jgi:hypothetical protein
MPREIQPTKPPSMRELRDELQVAINARRELPVEMEDVLVTNFLQQIERAIDLRVDARVAEVMKHQKQDAGKRTGTVAASIALSIPLVAITAWLPSPGGAISVGVICAMVVLVNILALFRR